MKFYWLVLGTLAVWRITHILNAEDGPREIFVRMRRFAGHGFWGDLLDCFYCLSLWVALPISWSLGETWEERLLLWPAFSAAGILLERLSSIRDVKDNAKQDNNDGAAIYFEAAETTKEEHQNVVLR